MFCKIRSWKLILVLGEILIFFLLLSSVDPHYGLLGNALQQPPSGRRSLPSSAAAATANTAKSATAVANPDRRTIASKKRASLTQSDRGCGNPSVTPADRRDAARNASLPTLGQGVAATTPGNQMAVTPGQRVAATTPGQRVAATPGQRAAATPGQRVAATPGQRVAATPGKRVAATPGQRAAATPGQRVAAPPDNRVAVTPTPGIKKQRRRGHRAQSHTLSLSAEQGRQVPRDSVPVSEADPFSSCDVVGRLLDMSPGKTFRIPKREPVNQRLLREEKLNYAPEEAWQVCGLGTPPPRKDFLYSYKPCCFW